MRLCVVLFIVCLHSIFLCLVFKLNNLYLKRAVIDSGSVEMKYLVRHSTMQCSARQCIAGEHKGRVWVEEDRVVQGVTGQDRARQGKVVQDRAR